MKNKIDPQKLIKKLIPIFYKAGSKSIQCAKKIKIYIKDDQTILLILYLKENNGNISLLRTTEGNDLWFPLKTVLSGSNQYELLDRI